ncbi:hypothetical protein DEU56DRAFT_756337 [Suillus clintonianus]|uniref:uncharacterized protein n=1 Tax=Suillus clintonianus TaxID=1904413 RepID=UPI001B88130F|nr:uncharacterized protein DEU56DRAFT_756337 [Suillus clintonianus]KAG2136431.1 hypothetical protein DEU56DRAFT_756337 [Suillus clintonianus]
MADNVFEILQDIMECGILDSSPDRQTTARTVQCKEPGASDDGWNSDTDMNDLLAAIENCGILDKGKENLIDSKKPRGRPKKKLIKRTVNRSTKKQACPEDWFEVEQSAQNNGRKPIIRATISPVPEDVPADRNVVQVSNSDRTTTGRRAEVPVMVSHIHGGDKAQQMLYESSGALEETGVTKNRGRGRPKKHVVGSRSTVSKKKVLDVVTDTHDHGKGNTNTTSSGVDNEEPGPRVDITMPDTASRAMSRPILWTDAWNNLQTLQSSTWLDAAVANFYLCHVWYEGRGRTCMRYLDMYAAMAGDLCDHEIQEMRINHFIDPDAACPMVPVGFIVHHSQHFFAVIFDFIRHTAHVLGRNISNHIMHVRQTNLDDWEAWEGPRYWRNVAALHGWTAGDVTDVCIRTQDWTQNGVDCGPIACSVLEQALTCGLDTRGNLPPIHLKCGHKLRMEIFRVVLGRIKISCTDYMMLLDSPKTHWMAHDIPDEDDPEDHFHHIDDHNVTSHHDDNQYEEGGAVEKHRVSEVPSSTEHKIQAPPTWHQLRRVHAQKHERRPVIRATISPVPGGTVTLEHVANVNDYTSSTQGSTRRSRGRPKRKSGRHYGPRLKKNMRPNLPEGHDHGDEFEFLAHDNNYQSRGEEALPHRRQNNRSLATQHARQTRATCEGEEITMESRWSPGNFLGEIDDDEYRPSPPPLPEVRLPSLEAPPPPLAKMTVGDITCRAMARPCVWTSAWDNCRTLGFNERLEATVANFYLLHVWYEALNRSRMRYVDVHAAMAKEMADEDLERFRRNHFVPHDGGCPVVPVGFIVCDAEFFISVIFDFQERKAHILDCHISDGTLNIHRNDWSIWGGPEYWRKIATLHDWSPGDVTDVSVIHRDVTTDVVDCGLMACSVLAHFLISGVDGHGNLPPFQTQCGHKLRIDMLRVVAGRIRMSCSDYLMLLDNRPDDWLEDDIPDDEVINSIQHGRHQAECLELLRKLTIISATCSACQSPILNQAGRSPLHHDENRGDTPVDRDDSEDGYGEDEDHLGTILPAERKAKLVQLFKANKELAGSRNRNAIPARAVGTHLQIESEPSAETDGQVDSQRSTSASATRRRVSNWNLGSNKRFPRPIAPVPLVAYSGRRWLQDNRNFDDYEGGPTIEMLRPPRDVNPTMTIPGWRHAAVHCLGGLATMAHIMPVGTTDCYDASKQVPDRVTGEYTLDRRGPDQDGRCTRVSDVDIMSASEIIDSVQYDPPLHDECRFGHNAFVRGRTSHRYGDGPALYIDLEKDAIQFSEDEIEISVDIDSIIWTTKTFRCRGSVGIYVTPPFQVKPGIFKHNHTYVDITIPQSEADAHVPGGRTEWLSKRFPMSAIPHACIGRISSASSTLNLYIAFPRMIHRHPVNGRRITLIPQEVLDIFWDRVLLPSIGDCTDASWAPYLKHTLEEARYKANGAGGRRGGWGPPKSIPLSDDDFKDVQERMQDRIRDGEAELSMFGSLFFILEGKGIKLLTKDGQRGRFSGPEEALRRNLSDLDWPYMMNRQHGELLVDVGISFTPRSPDVPVVGVWRLDALEASFGAGGYKRGEMHHHNTLSRYGALQAEMQQERAQQTHIAFRSTYNLYYESIRTNNNRVSFASDSDAYKLSPPYMAECFEMVKVIDGCKEKTYGVRDEYRVSGQAARIMLENIDTKATEYLRSDPVLWIPSKVWFELIRRRVRELQRTQIAIVRKNPPNLGILTGLLNHMLRSTTSTPIIYDFHVRESLALLENSISASETCLDEVQQVDDVNVLALMGVNAKAQRDRAVGRKNPQAMAESELEDYPLGRTPTWTRLKLFNMDLSVGRLFIMFTRHIWLMLTTEVLKGVTPHPITLQEAMKCWTITSVDDVLSAVAFEACNSGLQDHTGVTAGRMGPRSRGFGDRSTLFFPDPDASYKDNTQWSTLWEGDGYIAEFHRTMQTMDEDQQASLKQGLSEVFSEVHCLPASGSRVWTQKNDAIIFVTNPTFYRIDCIGRGGDRQQRATRARRTMKLIKGKRIFAADLMDSQPFDTDGNLRTKTERQKRREIRKKMTMTKRNQRIPPPPRSRKLLPFPMHIGQSLEGENVVAED